MNKVLLLTEGGIKNGFGHITRCLSLYQAFEENGLFPEFIINGDASVENLLKGEYYKLLNWLENKTVLPLLTGADIIVIDSYYADYHFYEKVSALGRLAVFLDDTKRLSYPKGIVLNGSGSARSLNYPVTENIQYLLGEKYALLRKVFWDIPAKTVKEIPESVLITVGGADYKNMTPLLLRLISANFSRLNKRVIINSAFDNTDKIMAEADNKTIVLNNLKPEEICEAMQTSDMAVSSAGQTLYELAAAGVPAISFTVADNQLPNALACNENLIAAYAGNWDSPHLEKNILDLMNQRLDYEKRKKLSGICQEVIDSKGSRRVAGFCLEQIGYS